ncbi:MAG TPA: T9SS type A sorting domain-containing protein, partial [Chitinophagaceae bacterium]
VRAGTNADVTNPYFLYMVNQVTGAMTLVPGGPYKEPSDPTQNLQVNGIGVNRKDGFIYGMATQGTNMLTVRLMRLDSTYKAVDLGVIPPPATGAGMLSIINSAAGDMDTAGNYYFSAFTVNPTPAPAIAKFYLGRISNVQAITAGPLVVEYFEVDVSGANCSAYISSLSIDPNNSGLKDFSYNGRTKSFFTYATYKPTGAANFSAQLLELRPVAGSSPLRYQLICNATVNTHSAETAGTLIDVSGKFTVLFTDGSFGMLNRDATGVYTGAFTMINTSTGLPNPLRGDMGTCGLATADTIQRGPLDFDCPANYATVRAGTNADITNPYFLYTVNGITGAHTLLPGGPLLYPSSSQTLQMNGIGINKLDGLIYGIAQEGNIHTGKFVKTDRAYNVTIMGDIPPPVNANGTSGFVNMLSGTMDQEGNYYFVAATTKAGNGAGGMVLDKLWMGKITDAASVTGVPAPAYLEIDWSGNPCGDFLESLDKDVINNGFKDIFYHPVTRTFFTYVTYKLPGDNQYSGQMIEIKPVGNPTSPNLYRMHCKNRINMHNAETAGVMVTNEGTFMILLTDGTVGKIPRTGNSFNYSGDYEVVNNTPGLPTVIRGDLTSCTDLEHPSTNPGPSGRVSISFNVAPNPVQFNQDIVIRWTLDEPATLNVAVYDSYGTIVRTVNNVWAVRGGQLVINATNLAAGVYYVRATSQNGRDDYRVKILKAN